MKKKKTGIARLIEIAGAKKGLLIISGVLSVVYTVLQFVPFVSIYFIINELFTNAGTQNTIDFENIRFWGIIALVSLLVSLVIMYVSTMSSHIAAFNILYDLRVKLAEHLSKVPMGYHTNKSTGAIKKIVEVSVEKIENFIAHQLPDLIAAICFPLFMLIAMFILDWRLALATSVPVVFAFGLQMVTYSHPKNRDRYKEYHDALEDMNSAGVEYVRGMPAVKVFGLTVKSFLSFYNSIEYYKKIALGITYGYKTAYSWYFVIVNSLITFILPMGVFLLSRDPANQAFAMVMLLFLVIAPGLTAPVLKLMYLGGGMREINEGIVRIDEIMAEKPMAEPITPKVPQRNSIEFNNVNFSYGDREDPDSFNVLHDLNFVAKEGEMTALVGPSGSGKSTIANLIPRFWDVNEGNIEIGGVDIKDIGTEKLFDHVSFVFQDVHIFYDTIAENIRMGNNGATMDEVINVAKISRCHDFIMEKENGYETKIGEGGTYLSGGEAQRLSIARALLKNAPILVLDEATAFADPENEVEIQKGISELIKGKTVIIIAHRLSTIKNANSIIVIEEGKINAQGTHEQLLEKSELYSRMWNAHIDAENWLLKSKKEKEHSEEAIS